MDKEQIMNRIEGNVFNLIVKVNASKTEITGYDKERNAIKMNVKAIPEKGKANAEIVKFLSKLLKRKVEIIAGTKSNKKVIKLL